MSRKKWTQLTIAERDDIVRRYEVGQRPKDIGDAVRRPVKTIYSVLTKRGVVLRGPQKTKRLTEPKPQAMPMREAPKAPPGELGLPIARGLFDSAAAARARMMAGR